MKIHEIIERLAKIGSPEELISDVDLMVEFKNLLVTNYSVKDLELVLIEIEKIGLTKKFSNIIGPSLCRLSTQTSDNLVVAHCFYILADMLEYEYITLDIQYIDFLTSKSRLKEPRHVKLSKCELIVLLLKSENHKLCHEKLLKWVQGIFRANDSEYIDLLAFAIGIKELKITNELAGVFKDHIIKDPYSEASAEMAISLARIKDPFIVPYVREALGDKAGKAWIEAAILMENHEFKSKLQQLLVEKDPVAIEFQDEINKLEN